MEEKRERSGFRTGVKAVAPWVALGAGVCVTIVLAVLIATGDPLGDMRLSEWAPWLAGAGLILWATAFFWQRASRRQSALLTTLLVAVAAAAVFLHNGRLAYKTLAGERIRTWSMFHYYIGSKYFPELGYLDLYRATLAKDDEWQAAKLLDKDRKKRKKTSDFGHIRVTRDMTTYRQIYRTAATKGYSKERFSPERWERFGIDTRLMRARLRGSKWKQVFIDLGNNSTPAWNLLGYPLANLFSLDSKWFIAIAASDLPVHLAIFLALWWAFGIRVAAAAALWMNTISFNKGRLLGGFFQYDWLASCAVGLALYRKERPVAAGAVLSWGVMTRVFPAFIAVPIFVRCVVDFVRRKRGAVRTSSVRLADTRLRFAIALTVCSIALAGLSHVNGRGVATWPEWLGKISVHSRLHPVTSNQRIGVGKLALHAPNARDAWSEPEGNREKRLEQSRLKKLVLQIVAIALLVPALLRRKDEDAMILMLFAAFAFATVSRYYASIWVLLLALGQISRDGKICWPAALSGAFLLAMVVAFRFFGGETSRYFFANYEAYLMFSLLCVGYVVTDLRHWRRARK